MIYPQNIVYELAQNETVRHFLSGKWLELFVEHQVQQILNRYQEEQGAEVSVCSNVILSEAASVVSTHELSYFWNYRVANCATITQELESMIAKQIEITAALSTD